MRLSPGEAPSFGGAFSWRGFSILVIGGEVLYALPLIEVCIYDGQKKTYHFRRELRKMGFRFQNEPDKCWYSEVEASELVALEDWCFKRRLEIETPYSKRSADYRKAFFEANTPNAGRSRYFCAYCGLPMRKDRITVDHLIAVKRAQQSRFYLNLLRKWGCDSVNDVRNLVPSCGRCNSRKGTKAGVWVLRGKLGRRAWFWVVKWSVYGIIVLGGICIFVVFCC
mgnify:CR=1 FL=1